MTQRVIYDVGLHKGEDTEYYLARGFRVVGIEADPDLVEYCRHKFQAHIDSGMLTIVHGAVVKDDSLERVSFYKNREMSVWGTVEEKWAERNAMLGAASTRIDVPVVNLGRIFSEHGCPHYMKIDIEGMDVVCMEKLLASGCRPKYLSIESEKVDFSALVREFDVFEKLGYTRFFIQQQQDIDHRRVAEDSSEGKYVDYRFPYGSSGPFGSDLGTGWLSREEAIDRYRKIFREYRLFGDESRLRRTRAGRYVTSLVSRFLHRPIPGWYDTHAALE